MVYILSNLDFIKLHNSTGLLIQTATFYKHILLLERSDFHAQKSKKTNR